ncbi:sodium-dependent transporter [Parasphingopyxis marina]|uniref:Sodium-dependent transporter n=1 Tax=Parasphingopyxis marina TaxID=2761622 RepID=A0A842HW86_9SPHN|nr:sodium-dependent transporter [Parasphingopyxis marina]MBC2776743.1 sodium-dependent transporter [Parasphingopyxis marina]
MAGPTHVTTEGWSSRWAFILAAIGAAVGLGNVWRFPTLAGENGGGAFVLFYIGCVVLIGLPLILSEIIIGRAGRSDAVGSVRNVAEQSGVSRGWTTFGWMEIISAFLILSFYSVVAGWVIYYAGVMGGDFFGNLFSGAPFAGALQGEEAEAIQGRMTSLFGNIPLLLAMHTVFMGVTYAIVARGVHDGIEKAALYLMPAFFVLLIAITIYGAFVGNFGQAVAFMFTPDFSKLDAPAMNAALGQALFSMSLGSAALITYGAYVSKDTKLPPTAAMIAVADTGVAIIAGLMIFPIVFAVGLDPAAGPTLVFQSLPVAFQQMPGGSLIGFLFFVLIFFAALTSSISLLEGPVSWGINELGWSRFKSATIFSLAIFIVGIACLLSLNVWSDVRLLPFWSIFAESSIFDVIDGFTGKVMLPVAAFLTAIFIGWRADKKLVAAETGLEGGLFALWRFLVAWLAPIGVAVILVFGLFPGLLA